jgi:uncharacterized protein YceK
MRRVVAIGALLLALTGCGTVQNFERDGVSGATPYGGVSIATHRYRAKPQDGGGIKIDFPDSLCAADVALSAVGDTLTLPVTASLSAWRFGERLWYLAFYYDNTPPRSNTWREFWFNEPNAVPEGPLEPAERSTQPTP